MKIKIKKISYREFAEKRPYHHLPPRLMSPALRGLVRMLSKGELKECSFTSEKKNMEGIHPLEPCLYLMNHSSFIDLKIAFQLIGKKPFNIVCTDDGFIGKRGFMRALGCIPTKKFLQDTVLVKDMVFTVKKLHSSILMYPEATYSFDGRNAVLPDSLGKCIKMLKVPVVMITTHGAFLRDPLYNNLQVRKTKVSAEMECILSKSEIDTLSVEEINEKVRSYFNQNAFLEQKEKNILITEDFRADYLNRILYRCPHCEKDYVMVGKGTHLSCSSCGASYFLKENGELFNEQGNTLYSTVYDWYDYEKKEIEKEIDDGGYHLECAVDIYAMKDMKYLYQIGEGILSHSKDGFHLTGCNGELEYHQDNQVSYSLYSDYYWYELGDMICVGNLEARYYCVFKEKKDLASKARLAVQYLYQK